MGAADRHASESRPLTDCRVGGANLRPLILLASACAQGLACLEVSQFAGASLYSGFAAGAPAPCSGGLLLMQPPVSLCTRLCTRPSTLPHFKALPAHAGKVPPLVASAVLLILLAGGAAARVAFRLHSVTCTRGRPAWAQPRDGDVQPPAGCPALAGPLEWDTNLGAMLAAATLRFQPATAGRWVDPAAAIAIALVLSGRWAAVARTQVGWAGGPG